MGQSDFSLIEPLIDRLTRHSELNSSDIAGLRAVPTSLYRAGRSEDIVRMGDSGNMCHLLVAGFAGRFQQTAPGTRQIVSLHLPGELLSLDTFFAAPRDDGGVLALTPVMAAQLPSEVFRALVHSSRMLTQALWQETMGEASRTARLLRNVGQLSAVARLAHVYCEIACRLSRSDIPHNDHWYDFRPIQSAVGEMLGLSVVHVNRSYRALREMNLLEVGPNGFRTSDALGLAKLADFDPAYLAGEVTLLRADPAALAFAKERAASELQRPMLR